MTDGPTYKSCYQHNKVETVNQSIHSILYYSLKYCQKTLFEAKSVIFLNQKRGIYSGSFGRKRKDKSNLLLTCTFSLKCISIDVRKGYCSFPLYRQSTLKFPSNHLRGDLKNMFLRFPMRFLSEKIFKLVDVLIFVSIHGTHLRN